MKYIFSSCSETLRRLPCKSVNLHKVMTLSVIALSFLFNVLPVQAQAGITLENVGATVQFGQQITFVATIKSSFPIQSASIIILDESQGTTYTEPLDIQSDGSSELYFDPNQNSLHPFANVKWHYQFAFSDGSTAQSEMYSVRYVDNRFQWQTLDSGSLRVNWYEGDSKFGQAALDVIQSGLSSVSNLIAVDLAQPVEIFIYANADDLRATLSSGSQDWIAGHADPALGVVTVVIAPGTEQTITLQQRVPHELMHVMLYRALGAGYANIPAWLNEGMATLVEMYPNTEYDRVLKDAATSNDLISLNTLCVSFPADPGQAFLAYAESRSFASYLQQTYGSSGLLKLASSYTDGVDCERGTEIAFGLPLPSLEAKWRSTILGQNAWLPALQNMTPYLVLLCIVLFFPFIGIVTALRKKRKS